MNFQGRLLTNTGAVVADGNYNMEFKLYAGGDGTATGDTSPAISPGSLVWTEDWLNHNGTGQGVVVKNGYFSVQLGTITSLPSSVNLDNSTMWLSMTVASGNSPNGATSTTCTTFAGCNSNSEPEMLPMKSLSAAPFALNADNANQVNSYLSNNFLDLAVPAAPTASLVAGGTLTLSQAYYYEITATNAAGETLGSTSATATPVSSGTQSIKLVWTQVNGATGYKIYRNTSNTFTSGSLLLTAVSGGQTVGYTDTGTATGAGLPPTTVTGTTVTLQSWNGQTNNILQAETSTGTVVDNIDASGNIHIGSGLGVDTTTSSGTLTIGGTSGGTNATIVDIGTITNAPQTINVGQAVINAGNEIVNIGTASTSSGTDTVTVGSTNGSSSTTINGGTGNVTVKGNNSQVNSPLLSLQQAGTGDSSVEFRNTSTSFYAGVDSDNSNSFDINSKAAATLSSDLGQDYTSQQPDSVDSNTNEYQATQFIAPATGTISSLNVAFDTRVNGSSAFSVAIFSDSSGAPANLLGKHTGTAIITTPTPGAINWNNMTLDSPVSVTSGTAYWLAFATNDGTLFKQNADGTGNSYYEKLITPGTWGATFTSVGSLDGTSTGVIGVYGAISTGGLTDTFSNDLLSLSTAGALTLRGTANTTAAFAVQDSSAYQIFDVDTSNNQVIVGSPGNLAGKIAVAGANGEASVTIQSANFTSTPYTIFLPSETGDVCTNAVGGTCTTAGAGFIFNQSSTPGTAQTGNFDITGTGIAATAFQSPAFQLTATAAGNINFAASAATAHSLTITGQAATAGTGGGVTIQGGAAGGANAGGTVALTGGSASATAGSNGGAITLTGAAGSTTGTGGTGGGITLTGGNSGGSGNNAGGAITLAGGSATGSGAAGGVVVKNVSNSSNAFNVENTSGNSVLTVDSAFNTAQGQVILGSSSHNNGQLTFDNSAGATSIGLLVTASNTNSYNLDLPLAGPAVNQCLQTTTASTTQLTFGACAQANAAITHVGGEWDEDSGTPSPITLGVSPATQGDLMMLGIQIAGAASVSVTSVSGGGVTTWTKVNSSPWAAGPKTDMELYEGTVTATGSQTITVNYSGSLSGQELIADEYAAAGSSAGTIWQVVGSGATNGTNATVTLPGLTTTAAQELYYGYAETAGSMNVGSGTGPFTYTKTTFGDGNVYYANTSAATTYTPSYTQGSSATYNTVAGLIIAFNPSGYINNGTSIQQANFNVQASTSGSVAATLEANSAGAGDILDLLNGSGVTVGKVTSTGAVADENSTNSTTAFQIQNSAAGNLLTADTTNMRLGVNVTYAAMGTLSSLAAGAATSGGSLSGVYKYEVTSVDSAGGESLPSNEVTTASLGSPNQTEPLTWTAISGASGYRVYRTASGGGAGTETFLADALTNAYTDTGGTATGTAVPPSTNTAYLSTNISNSSLQLSVGGNGTPTGQEYVSGTVPSGAIGNLALGSSAQGIAVQGNYAYIVDQTTNQLQIVDISNPASPAIISAVSIGANDRYVYLSGHYAYVPNYNQNSLQIIDVSNPFAPSTVATINEGPGTHPADVYVQGKYAYLVDNSVYQMQIFDVSNPAAPLGLGTVTLGNTPRYVVVQGRYAYVSENGANQMQIVDVSNPNSPSVVDTLSTGGSTNPFNEYIQGRYLYLTLNNASHYDLDIIDISNPLIPQIIATFPTGASTAPQSVKVQGRYAYINVGGTNTLQVIDVSNPYAPQSVGTVSTGTGSGNFDLAVQGRYAYVTNSTTNNMVVFDIGGAYIQQLQAGGTETGTLQVDSNAQVYGDENIQGGLEVGQSLSTNGSLAVSGNSTIQGSLGVVGGIQGGINVSGLSTPGAPTISNQGTAGGSTYSYAITAVSASGGTTPVSGNGSTSTGANPLTGTNYNTITWTPVSGAVSYNVYRTADGPSPASIGLLGNTTATTYNDQNGSVTSAPPTLDTSGQMTVQGAATFKDPTNTTTAFQIQNTTGTTFFTADSVNKIVTTDDLDVGPPPSVATTGRLFSDGFENGNFGLWNLNVGTTGTSTIAVNSSPVRQGKYAAAVSINTSGKAEMATDFANSSTAMDVRFYAYVSTASATVNLVSMVDHGTDTNEQDVFLSGGDLCEYNGTGAGTTTCSTTVPSLNTWHEIELDANISSSVGTINMYLDGVAVTGLQLSGQNTGTNNLNSVYLGDANTSLTHAGNYSIDDLVVDTIRPGDSSSLYVSDSLHVAGTSTFGNTISAVSQSTNAILGYSNGAGIGVYGYSNSYAGVLGQSTSGNSGIFQSSSSSNTSPTLITQQFGTATADLLQAQNSAGVKLDSIDYSGDLTVGNGTYNAGPSRLFSDGFESDNFSQWTSGPYGSGATIATSPTHSGNYAAKFTLTGSGTGATTNFVASTTVDARAYVYVTSQGANGANLMGVLDANDNNEFTVYRDSSGNIDVWDSTTSSTFTSTTTMSTGAWHLLEEDVVANTSTGSITVSLDGTVIAALTQTNINTGPNSLSRLAIGDGNSGHTETYSVDDVSVDDGHPGSSANLNVGDSLHVDGTSTIGVSLAVGSTTNNGGLGATLVVKSDAESSTTMAYKANGGYTLTVPNDVTSITVEAWGAGGGGASGSNGTGLGGSGGGGGYVKTTLAVVPGENLTVGVGSGGIKATENEGAAGTTSNGGAGGGMSYVQRGGTALVEAPGGGGGGGSLTTGAGGQGGGGAGAASGGAGGGGTGFADGGGGAGTGAGGTAGAAGGATGAAGVAGIAINGGNGAAGSATVCTTAGSGTGGAGGTGDAGKSGIFNTAAACADGGGGGGGQYGGGGGGSTAAATDGSGGGGGGSSLATGSTITQTAGGNGTSGTGGTISSDATYTSYCAATSGVGGAGKATAAAASAGNDGCVVVTFSSGAHAKAFDVQSTAGADLFSVATNGSTLFKDATDNAYAFQVQNASASTMFDIDTAGDNITIGNSSTFITLNGYVEPFTSGTITAIKPGTTNTAETWHALSIPTGFTDNSTSGSTGFEYRMLPDGNTQICLNLLATGTPADPLNIGTLPSGYYDSSNNQDFAIEISKTEAAGAQSSHLDIRTNGQIFLYGAATLTPVVEGCGQIPTNL